MSNYPRPLGPMMLLIVGALLAMAIFWVGFMLAPAAVLLIFCLAMSAGERGRHQRQEEAGSNELAGGRLPEAARTEQTTPSGRFTRAQDSSDTPIEGSQEGHVDDRETVGNQPKGIRA